MIVQAKGTVELSAGNSIAANRYAINATKNREPVCGTLASNVVWTSDKIYVATCNLMVATGYTLTIQPGTIVQFQGSYILGVGGTLIADGIAGQPIRFEPMATNGMWGGISYSDTAVNARVTDAGLYEGGNILRNVQMRRAALGIRCSLVMPYVEQVALDGGGVHCTNGDPDKVGWIVDSSILSPVVITGLVSISNTHVGADLVVNGAALLQANRIGEPATMIVAGGAHVCALTSRGTVKCWGANESGQLGNGGTTNVSTPQAVAELSGGVAAIAAGQHHTCALTSRGTVKCWGANESGQLGNGGMTNASVPQDVVGLSGGATAIAAGGAHTCALLHGGVVKCWGANESGELGNGGMTNVSTPQAVAWLSSGVMAIALGRYHTCALMSRGAVKCWGYNQWGQLGNGGMTDASTPQDVAGLSSGVTAITAGFNHTCALMSSGVMKCWGANVHGELGNGGWSDASTPQDVAGLSGGAMAIVAGGAHACALMSSGSVKCWGENEFGQLGNGGTTDASTPQEVTGLSSGATAMAAGGAHVCALMSRGAVKCWGENESGQLGNGGMTDASTPQDVTGLSSSAMAIAAGDRYTCAVTSEGGVKCWGRNGVGQLGNGGTTDASTPQDVAGLSSGAMAIAAGGAHMCALLSGGGVKCWGYNVNGQLGNGGTTNANTPQDVIGLSSGVTAIVAGGQHTCALLSGGGVKCWGYNVNGQLGNGGTMDASTPQDVVGLSGGATAIAAGGEHTCAVTNAGEVKCWGYNLDGELGNGGTMNASTPQDVVGLSGGVTAIAAGGQHTCALLSSDGAKCWGLNEFGQLGDGMLKYCVPHYCRALTPQDVYGLSSGAMAIVAGGGHTCALTSGGEVKCWGSNEFGQRGDGGSHSVPQDVAGLRSGSARISASGAVSDSVFGSVFGSVFSSVMLSNTVAGEGVYVGDRVLLSGNEVIRGGIVVGANSQVTRNSVEGASSAGLSAGDAVTATLNRLVGNGVGMVISGTGFVFGNLIANNSSGGLYVGAATVLSNTFTGNGGNTVVVQHSAPVQFTGNNLEGNKGLYDLYLDVSQGQLVDVQGNWWGVTDLDAIRARIYDFRLDETKALADITMSASAPVQDAPAYVRTVTVLPSTTIGIETATFEVDFSREVQSDVTPTLFALGTENFPITSMHSLTSMRAVFDADVTALWTRGVYSLMVASAVGADGVEIAPNTNFSLTVAYDDSLFDWTPPSTPYMTMASDGSLTQLKLRWVTSDAESGITRVRYAIGTRPGGTDVVSWTTIDASASFKAANLFTIVHTGLNLEEGAAYYASVQAQNGGGLWSEQGGSNQVVGGVVTVPLTPWAWIPYALHVARP